MEHSFSPYSALRPVKLLKDRLKVLHGSVCDQHDGLVTHAALTVHPRLHTSSWTIKDSNHTTFFQEQSQPLSPQTSFRILKDSFMAFLIFASPLTCRSSTSSLKCCKRKKEGLCSLQQLFNKYRNPIAMLICSLSYSVVWTHGFFPEELLTPTEPG